MTAHEGHLLQNGVVEWEHRAEMGSQSEAKGRRQPEGVPEADIDRRAGRARPSACTATVPDAQQSRLGIQRLGALKRQPDRQLAGIGEQVFVAEIGIVGRKSLSASFLETALEPL